MADPRTRLITLQRPVAAFFYVCIILFTGYMSVRHGLSNYYAVSAVEGRSVADAERAIAFAPNNASANKARGELLLKEKNFPEAAAAFENAIAHRKNDHWLWMQLGHSLFRSGESRQGEEAYRRAISAAPNYYQPYYYFGRILLEHDRPHEAFPYLTEAAAREPNMYSPLLDLSAMHFPDDAAAIQNAVPPRSDRAWHTLAHYFIKRGFMTAEVRSYLLSESISDQERNEFIRQLISKQNFKLAHEIWSSKISPQSDQPIYDGGFELITESNKSGFGWHIDQKLAHASVARTNQNVHSGSFALEIDFAGDVEINRKIISQLFLVKPQTQYRLKFFYRSEELISAGLPNIVISSGTTNISIAQSHVLQKTNGKWDEMSVDFPSGDAAALTISLLRNKCEMSPCPIFGSVHVDDFVVSEMH